MNPLSVRRCAFGDTSISCLMEEKMFEIAGILGISVKGRSEGFDSGFEG